MAEKDAVRHGFEYPESILISIGMVITLALLSRACSLLFMHGGLVMHRALQGGLPTAYAHGVRGFKLDAELTFRIQGLRIED